MRAAPIILRLALALALGGAPAMAQGDTLEYAIKAAYLFKFTPFVEWPSTAFATSSSPFYVCVLGDNPFGSTLDQTVSGRQVGDHPVKVRRLQTTDGARECQILYFATSHAPLAAATLDKVHGAPVLTVTEQSLGVSGEVVQFIIKDGHVRFTIDAAAAAANRMVISAKLLSLAASERSGS
jgi:hypothetical protein